MNDHVAVLREMREHLAIFAEGAKDAARRGADGDLASLDHAIAAVAELEALKADNAEYQHSLTLETEARAAAEAERDALVARLGELEKEWRELGPAAYEDCADDLARVVKEGGG